MPWLFHFTGSSGTVKFPRKVVNVELSGVLKVAHDFIKINMRMKRKLLLYDTCQPSASTLAWLLLLFLEREGILGWEQGGIVIVVPFGKSINWYIYERRKVVQKVMNAYPQTFFHWFHICGNQRGQNEHNHSKHILLVQVHCKCQLTILFVNYYL